LRAAEAPKPRGEPPPRAGCTSSNCLEGAEDFALAGGEALIVRGDVDRQTRDLDFFGLDTATVDRLAPVAEQALREAGLNVERILDNPGFVRFVVMNNEARTEVDIASDARLFPLEEHRGFRMLSGEELAVDKLLALFGRAEARDFVDLMAVEKTFGLDRLFRLASEKDRGFSAAVFAEMMDRFGRLRRDEFAVDDDQFDELGRRVVRWRAKALEFDRQPSIEHNPDRGRDNDLGMGGPT